MSKVTVESLFDIPDRYYRGFGFSLLYKNIQTKQKMHEKLFWLLKKVGFWFYIFGMGFVVGSNIIHEIMYPSDLSHRKIPYFVMVPFVILKMVMIYFHREIISEIITDLKDIFVDTNLDESHYSHLLSYIRMFKFVCFGTIAAYIMKVSLSLIEKGMNEIVMENLWVPIDNGYIMNPPIIYVGSVGSLVTFSSETIIGIITTLIAVSFDVLNLKVKNMNHVKEGEKSKYLKELIELQIKSFAVAEKYEKYFSPIFLILFLQSSISICIAGHEIMEVNKTADLLIYILFLMTTLLQIFSACYFCQKIIDSSQQTALVAYENNWYELKDIRFQKAVLLFIMRSQKQQQITAKGFVSISLTTFMQVILGRIKIMKM